MWFIWKERWKGSQPVKGTLLSYGQLDLMETLKNGVGNMLPDFKISSLGAKELGSLLVHTILSVVEVC